MGCLRADEQRQAVMLNAKSKLSADNLRCCRETICTLDAIPRGLKGTSVRGGNDCPADTIARGRWIGASG